MQCIRPQSLTALTVVLAALALAAPRQAHAQAPAAAGVRAPAADAVAPPPATPAEAPAAPVPAPTAEATELAKLRSDLDATQRELQEVKAAQVAAALPEETDNVAEQEKLKIYGFADLGFQYVQIDKSSLLANVYDVNEPDFVIGNLNLYFDAQPVEDWRALIEVRFTNAPHGRVTNYGGLGGTFTRQSTFADDPGGAALNAPLWGGSTVIERAWIEYNRLQPLKIRAGNYFTPFGIWNEDHGSPTLISLAWPQFMTQRWMPLRQTGLMAYGNAFAGSWELGYAATLSNGRQEESSFNIDGNMGFGGRLYARRDTGEVNSTLGVSFFSGKTRNKVINVTGVAPITFSQRSTLEYQEYVMGADASLDVGNTRIRSEGVVRRLTYTPGKREPLNPVLAPGGFTPDKWEHSLYVLAAQQLPDPVSVLEPYLWAEAFQTPTLVGDGVFVASAGLNVRFNSAVTWKNQFAYVKFFDWMYDSPFDNSRENIKQFYSRLVMAF